jgi:segregation and condensation protein B
MFREDNVDTTRHRLGKLASAVEAVLFSSDKPLTIGEICEVIPDADGAEIETALSRIAETLEHAGHGIELSKVAGGYQLKTRPEHAEEIRRLGALPRPPKLSQAALETLAIIAYRQPIVRSEMEVIRGVSVQGVLGTLLERKLIRIRGRAKGVGRPLLYGTSDGFLTYFGLSSLDDLPKPSELKEILEERGEAQYPSVTKIGDREILEKLENPTGESA